MTNYEALQNAKSKDEVARIFFEFEVEVNFRKGELDMRKWLDEERNPKETALKIFTILAREAKEEGEND